MKNICNDFLNGLENKYCNSDEKLISDYNSFLENKKSISEEELNNLIK